MSWTRTQVAQELLGVPVSTLRSWERSTGFKPTGASSFQEFTPATYDAADVAVLQVIHHASELGIFGSHLAHVHQAVAGLRPHFLPGWSGLCITTTDGRGWLIGSGVPGPDSVESIIENLSPPARIQLVAQVVVPR